MIRLVLLVAMVVLALWSTASAAATGTQGSEAQLPRLTLLKVDQSRYPLMQLHFQLRKPGGEVLPPGAVQDVRLVEGVSDADQVEVSEWRVEPAGQQPVRVLALVDLSESTGARVGPDNERKIDALKKALADMANLLQPGDQFALMGYHLEPGPHAGWGERPGQQLRDHFEFLTGEGYVTDPSAMLDAVNRLEVPTAYTAYTNIFNAAVAAIDWDQERRKPDDPATQLLLMTDGMDNRAELVRKAARARGWRQMWAPEESMDVDRVATRASDTGSVVMAIGFGDPTAARGAQMGAVRADKLRRLASEGRGRFLIAPDPERLRELYRLMAADLRAGEVVLYTSPRSYRGTPDGVAQPRTVQLQVQVDGRWLSAPVQRYTPAGVVGLPPMADADANRQPLLVAGLMAAIHGGLVLAALLARITSALLARWFIARRQSLAGLRFTPDVRRPPSRDDGVGKRYYDAR